MRLGLRRATMGARGLCDWCQTAPIVGRKRKYCPEHSRQASLVWKRKHRKLWKAAGDKYWLADWKNKTPEERRAYFRTYKRAYRKKRRPERPARHREAA